MFKPSVPKLDLLMANPGIWEREATIGRGETIHARVSQWRREMTNISSEDFDKEMKTSFGPLLIRAFPQHVLDLLRESRHITSSNTGNCVIFVIEPSIGARTSHYELLSMLVTKKLRKKIILDAGTYCETELSQHMTQILNRHSAPKGVLVPLYPGFWTQILQYYIPRGVVSVDNRQLPVMSTRALRLPLQIEFSEHVTDAARRLILTNLGNYWKRIKYSELEEGDEIFDRQQGILPVSDTHIHGLLHVF